MQVPISSGLVPPSPTAFTIFPAPVDVIFHNSITVQINAVLEFFIVSA